MNTNSRLKRVSIDDIKIGDMITFSPNEKCRQVVDISSEELFGKELFVVEFTETIVTTFGTAPIYSVWHNDLS